MEALLGLYDHLMNDHKIYSLERGQKLITNLRRIFYQHQDIITSKANGVVSSKVLPVGYPSKE